VPSAGERDRREPGSSVLVDAFEFEEDLGEHRVFKEPIGVCGLITPWNWPVNQIGCKVAPALAVGCTMVLKPSEVAPLSAYLWTQVMHEAGVPAGVFNMINGDGPVVGTALSKHPEVDMMSFTGSTRAGTLVAQNAAPTVKRVTQDHVVVLLLEVLDIFDINVDAANIVSVNVFHCPVSPATHTPHTHDQHFRIADIGRLILR